MRWVKRHLLFAYAMLAFAYLMLPIAVVVLFSFNAPSGRFNYVWEGFTLDNWVHWDAVPGISDAVVTSLEIGIVSTVMATILGTMIALALVRHRFPARGATNLLVFLPMSTPEIVLGASLLTLFLNARVVTGFATIFIAHVMFIVSYVVVTVKARLIDFDRHLEEAAMDLGANEWTTFRKITLPLLAPAILSAALLGLRALDRRLRDHVLRRRRDDDVPAVRVGGRPCVGAAAGERDRERDLPRGRRGDDRQRPVGPPQPQAGRGTAPDGRAAPARVHRPAGSLT